jgi:hypothetical protein
MFEFLIKILETDVSAAKLLIIIGVVLIALLAFVFRWLWKDYTQCKKFQISAVLFFGRLGNMSPEEVHKELEDLYKDWKRKNENSNTFF